MAMAIIAILAGMFGLSVFECSRADARGVGCMQFLQPAIDRMIVWFRYPRDNSLRFYREIFSGIGIALAVVLLWSLLRRRITSARLCLMVFVALAGEYLILQRQSEVGIVVTMVAPLLIALLSWGLPTMDDERVLHTSSMKLHELLGIVVLGALLLGTQFFSLNRLPFGWDTEFCPFRYLYWQDWSGLLLHEAGYHPQTSLGLAWHALMKSIGNVDEPDKYHIYIRYLSSAVALLKFIALFFFMRWLSGSFAAFLSVALLGFGPPENWWSRETNIHQLPGLMAIPLLWAWIAAWQKPTWLRFTILAIAIASMRLVYPSGMFLAFGPLFFFLLLLVFQPRQWLRQAHRMIPMLAGIAFWLTWRSIARWLHTGRWEFIHPLEVPGRYAPRSLETQISDMFSNMSDAFLSTFVYQVNPSHWTFALTLAPERCTTSIALVLSLLMFGRIVRWRANAIDLLLIISLGLSFAPGLLSEVAARRTGVSFLVLIVIAAREAQYLTSLLQRDGNRIIAWVTRLVLPAVASVYLMWVSSSIHFTGRGGEPHQVTRGRMMREEIQDDALIVYLSGFTNCDTFYSFYRDLKARECRTGYLAPEYEGSSDIQTLIDAPAVQPRNWVYERTGMKRCLDEHMSKQWKKIVYLVSDTGHQEELSQKLRARYPNASYGYKTTSGPEGSTYRVFVLTVKR